jgi:tRNA(fMet)-specific endonuclease VapC
MAGNSYLLDTNIAIAILNNEDRVIERLQGQGTFISLVVLGELYFGAMKSSHAEENIKRIDELLKRHPLLSSDQQTAQNYSAIKLALRRKGRPIPENDIWIAALAMQHRLTLITRDAHFEHIDGLPRQSW